MRKSVFSNLSILQHLVTVLTVVTLLLVGGLRALHPSLHMDESLYLGAALKALHGDPLLTTYWLDKIPLGPLLTIPGILIAGENSLGFHLSGLVAAISSVLIGQSLIRSICGKNLFSLGAQCTYFGIQLLPFMVYHHASAFTDPFLILFLTLFFRAVWRSLNSSSISVFHPIGADDVHTRKMDRKVHQYFTLALMVKFSAMMWFPILVGYWILKFGPAFWREGLKRLWLGGKFIWSIALIYMIANPGKLAPIAWFSALLSKDKNSKPRGFFSAFFHRLDDWTSILSDIFDHNFIFYGFSFLILMMTCWSLFWLRIFFSRKSAGSQQTILTRMRQIPEKFTQYLLLFLLPTFAHWVGLSLSGAALFPRYLYIFIPQLMLTLLIGLRFILKNKNISSDSLYTGMARGWRLSAFVGIAILVPINLTLLRDSSHFLSYWDYVTHQTRNTQSSRVLYTIRDELPRGSVIHHDALLWYLYPFLSGAQALAACHESECLEEQQKGRAPFDRQYMLLIPESGGLWELHQTFPISGESAPFFVSKSETTEWTFPTSHMLSEKNLRRALRLSGWAQSLIVRPLHESFHPVDHGQQLESHLFPSWLHHHPLPVLPLEIEVRIKEGLPAFLPKSLSIKGHITFSRGHTAQPPSFDQRWHGAYRLESLTLGDSQINLVDLAPLIYGSYKIPLQILDMGPIADSPFQIVTQLQWIDDSNGPAIRAKILSKRPS